MRRLLPLAALLVLAGCAPKGEPTTVTAGGETGAQATAPNGSGVAPIGSGASGGMTPVTGAENVGGGGFAGGGVAKDMARGAAAKAAGGGSTGDEGGE